MIIWRGCGFLDVIFVFGASLVMELITETVTRDTDFYQKEAWPLALALIVAGIVTWAVGKKLHARGVRAMSDQPAGPEAASFRTHTFFFVPMHYWAVVLLCARCAALRSTPIGRWRRMAIRESDHRGRIDVEIIVKPRHPAAGRARVMAA